MSAHIQGKVHLDANVLFIFILSLITLFKHYIREVNNEGRKVDMTFCLLRLSTPEDCRIFVFVVTPGMSTHF
jgi:hypothetical protein